MIKGIHHISMKCGTGEEFDRARDFYLNVLGFSAVREWPEGIMIDSGRGFQAFSVTIKAVPFPSSLSTEIFP